MKQSKVYYTNFHTTFTENLPQKLLRLMKRAGMDQIDFQDKYAAIKIHFGELGNLSFLRPNYAKAVADFIKERGGRPYLTDCNTLYAGSRKNALDHLDTACLNGFSLYSTGCHILIGDGLKGTDDISIPIDGDYIKRAKIGRAVMDADVFISLTHFKGHESTGFGGSLKNIGMGCGSRAGKMEMHTAGKPSVSADTCVSCHICESNCAHKAISFPEGKASIRHDRCVGCGRCVSVCPVGAVSSDCPESNDILNRKIAEYTLAVVKGRPCFHISLIVDVSPYCDCHPENDIPIIPNVGMFASFDPVALDMACADAVNRQPVIAGSILEEHGGHHHDHFTDVHPDTNWKTALDHAEKIGLGNKDYELITI